MYTNTQRRETVVRGATLSISPDLPLPVAKAWQSVARFRLRDEITGKAPRGRVQISTDYPGLQPRVTPGGIAGFAAAPEEVFPGLRTVDYSFNIRILADGYLPVAFEETVTQQADFPDTFIPLPWREIPLHRAPVELLVDVFERDAVSGEVLPVDGAMVEIVHYCRTPDIDCREDAGPFTPLTMFSSSPGFHAARRETDGAEIRSIALADGVEKRLLEAVRPGSEELLLSDSAGVAPGDLVRIEPEGHERAEYIVIDAIEGFPVFSPALARLDHPMRHRHREGASVTRMVTGALGAVNHFIPLMPGEPDTDASVGDRVVFTASAAGLGADAIVRITGGADAEFQRLRRHEGVAVGGLARLPAISRVDAVRLRVTSGADAQERVVTIDYDNVCNNRFQFLFSP